MTKMTPNSRPTLRRVAALCSALSGLTLAAAGSARADTARREIQGDYRRFTAAETTLQYGRIRKAAASFFSPSFTLYTPSGKALSYAQFLTEMKVVTTENRAVKEDAFDTQTMTRRGNALTETGVYVFSRTFLDVDQDFGAKGLPHSLSERTHYRGEWAKTGGHWTLQSLRLSGRTQIVDGKKFVAAKKRG